MNNSTAQSAIIPRERDREESLIMASEAAAAVRVGKNVAASSYFPLSLSLCRGFFIAWINGMFCAAVVTAVAAAEKRYIYIVGLDVLVYVSILYKCDSLALHLLHLYIYL